MSTHEDAPGPSSGTSPERGSFTKFLLVSAVVLLFLVGSAFALFYALWATRSPDYSGPPKLLNQEKPTVGFR